MMTDTALIVLAFLAGVVWATKRAAVGAPRIPSYSDDRAGARARASVSRLFAADDEQLVRSFADRDARLGARLRRQRSRAMRLFLRQTYQEFRAIMREAGEAAKHEGAEYGEALTSLSLRFHRRYFGLWLRAQLACVLFRPIPQPRLEEFLQVARILQSEPFATSEKSRA